MKKQQIPRVQDLIGLVNGLFPPSLAEEWDNVGLQVGDPASRLQRVMVCLDVSAEVLAEAKEAGATAVLSHHPLIFRPLKSLTPKDETGKLLLQAAQSGIAVLCAHTNLDRAAGGLNDWLAGRLGVDKAEPLATGGGKLLKLVIFVPEDHQEQVAEALFAGGAGSIGAYDRCSFRTEGTGTFRPGVGSSPFVGAPGVDESVREVRLETVVPQDRLSKVLGKMQKAHPYEEIAFDLVPLANQRTDVGLGRLGRLPQRTTLSSFAATVKKALGVPSLRVVGDPKQAVAKVALCGGSGASLLSEAARRGADVLVTGDVKYHEAKAAQSQGLALIDAGHFATEHLMVAETVRVLAEEASRRGLNIDFQECATESDPFYTV